MNGNNHERGFRVKDEITYAKELYNVGRYINSKLSYLLYRVLLGRMVLVIKTNKRAGVLVKWLWEETHVLKVAGMNPCTTYWVDIFSHIFVVKFVMFFEKTKINEKEAGECPF